MKRYNKKNKNINNNNNNNNSLAFHATALFLYPLKIKNQRFSDILCGYRERPIALNGLRNKLLNIHRFNWFPPSRSNFSQVFYKMLREEY